MFVTKNAFKLFHQCKEDEEEISCFTDSFFLLDVKPNMCNYFPGSHIHLGASLRYLIYRFLFSLSFSFPVVCLCTFLRQVYKRFIRRAMSMMRTARITTTLIAQCIVYQANHLSDKKTYFNLK
jgi:hypothetical protein